MEMIDICWESNIDQALAAIRTNIYMVSPEATEEATRALLRLPPSEVSSMLGEFLESFDPADVDFGIEALLIVDADRNFSRVSNYMAGGNRDRRWFVCHLLCDHPTLSALPDLIRTLENDKDADVKAEACCALAALNVESAREALKRAQKADFDEDGQGDTISRIASSFLQRLGE